MTNGHDAPVISRSSDFYNRWIIAQSISKVIQASPLDWSTRIGVYGGWGDGKTSLLNFLEKQQNDAGNIVIRYSSWGAGNELEAWDDFGRALIFGLDKVGINLGWFSRLKGRCHSWAGGTRTSGFNQYNQLCQLLISDPDYSGQGFSFGDDRYYYHAQAGSPTGNLSTWRRDATSHHLALTVRNCATLFGI